MSKGPEFRDVQETGHRAWFVRSCHFIHTGELLAHHHEAFLRKVWALKDAKKGTEMLNAHPEQKDDAYTLLIGLGFECLLKAVWVARQGTPTVKKLPGWWKSAEGHNLVRLAEGIDLKLSSDERKTLDDMTTELLWMARYPTTFLPNHRTSPSFIGEKISALHDRITATYASAVASIKAV